jgi:hypothetical protein
MSTPLVLAIALAVLLAVLLLGAVAALVLEVRRSPGAPTRRSAGPEVTGPEALRAVDLALRALVAACQSAGRDLPDLYAVFCSGQRVAVRLARFDPEPPAPWQADESGSEWTLARFRPAGGGPALADGHPYGLLVSLGLHQDERVLVNLARATEPIAVTGPGDLPLRLTGAFVAELLTGPVGRDAEVTLVGPAVTGALAGPPEARPARLRLAASLAEVHAARRERVPAHTPGSTGTFRAVDGGDPLRRLRLLVVAADQYRTESAGAGSSATDPTGGDVLLVVGELERAAWRLAADPDGSLDTGALDLTVDTDATRLA